jgi:hypothetical protein
MTLLNIVSLQWRWEVRASVIGFGKITFTLIPLNGVTCGKVCYCVIECTIIAIFAFIVYE